jgi:hypothetical protein
MQKAYGVFYFVFRWHGEASDISCAKTAVVQLIASFTPNHRHSKRQRHVRTLHRPVNVLEHELQQVFVAHTLSDRQHDS